MGSLRQEVFWRRQSQTRDSLSGGEREKHKSCCVIFPSSSPLPSPKRYIPPPPAPIPNPAPHLGVELAFEAAVLGELAEGLKPGRLREVRADRPWRGVRGRCGTGAGHSFRHLPPWPGHNRRWGPLGWLFSEQLVVAGKVKAVCPQVEITALCCCRSPSQVPQARSLQTTQGFSLYFCPFLRLSSLLQRLKPPVSRI